MTRVIIYHNPRCSKSRETLALLQEKKVEITIVEYLKEPLSIEQLQEIVALLNINPSELIRTAEPMYKQLRLEKATGAELVKAMVKHPILIERPIVIANGKAVIARPPSNILRIL